MKYCKVKKKKKIQVKTIMKYHHSTIIMALAKKTRDNGLKMYRRETSCTVGGAIKITVKNSMEATQEIENGTTI